MAEDKNSKKKTLTVTPLPKRFPHPRWWNHLTVDTEEQAQFLVAHLGIPRDQIWTFDEWMEIALSYFGDLLECEIKRNKKTPEITVAGSGEATK